jgi:hypothetical protein
MLFFIWLQNGCGSIPTKVEWSLNENIKHMFSNDASRKVHFRKLSWSGERINGRKRKTPQVKQRNKQTHTYIHNKTSRKNVPKYCIKIFIK